LIFERRAIRTAESPNEVPWARFRWVAYAIVVAALFIAVSPVGSAQTTSTIPTDETFGVYDQAADRALDRVLRDVRDVSAHSAPVQQPSRFAAYADGANRALDRVLTETAQTPTRYKPVVAIPNPANPDLAPQKSAEELSAFADRFWNGRAEDLRAALGRLASIRPALEQILAQEGIPLPFAAMVLVESGANPVALSAKSARGLWQFMPDTALRYGLAVNEQLDERTDLFKSTRAAARYLRDLYRTFGEWRLTLAAYNAGEGVLHEAIQQGHSFDFQFLSDRGLIPAETRTYVPAVFAAANLLQSQ